MQELQEVTIRYINCPDPTESAARRQRVIASEEQGLMEETAANIIAAATDSYHIKLNFDPEEESQIVLRQQSPQHPPSEGTTPQNQPKKQRGRPPKNKRMSPAIGISLRQRRISQVQNSPQIRRPSIGQGQNTRGNHERTGQAIQGDPGPSIRGTTPDTIIPTLERATENFRRPRSPIP
ncbi:unnamed protein product [Microthlaspi erraticum]|uniref:Uncharacterized protein n=1 Tax=Microthlaspi erraticum TaxID=1685480 RepID=A0A6D2JKJ5_9BRAS|nr:unnamed protein product [Microthlaspi erraticum]